MMNLEEYKSGRGLCNILSWLAETEKDHENPMLTGLPAILTHRLFNIVVHGEPNSSRDLLQSLHWPRSKPVNYLTHIFALPTRCPAEHLTALVL
jgi:hypothetical protein